MNILKEREEKMEQNIKKYKNNKDIQKKLIKLIEHTVKD